MTKDRLTEKDKFYLQNLFFDHWTKYNKQIDEQLSILSRYKSDLAKKYSLMNEIEEQILRRLESINGYCRDLEIILNKCENNLMVDCKHENN